VRIWRGCIASGGFQNTALPILGSHLNRPGATRVLKPGKVPQIGKLPALLGLDGLDAAIAALQKNA
jgi:hypothetical protein